MKTDATPIHGDAISAAFAMQALKATLTVVSFAAFLAGCGGGSDGPTATPVANDTAVAQAQSNGNLGNPGVMPPQSHPAGKTYGEWSAIWWQWAVKRPSGGSPLDDPDGSRCMLDQSGPVWFLAAGVGTPRTCQVPTGKFILFPIINYEWSAAEADANGGICTLAPGDQLPTTPTGDSQMALRACAEALRDLTKVKSLVVEVDGRELANTGNYNFESPADQATVFFPVQNNLIGIPATNPPSATRFAADGYWIMLAPLSAGTHTLHFHGEGASTKNSFSFDGQYTLVVVASD